MQQAHNGILAGFFAGLAGLFSKGGPGLGDVHIPAPGDDEEDERPRRRKKDQRPVEGVFKAEGERVLKPRGDGTAHTPFPYDIGALASLRGDQVPRFFAAYTDQDSLEETEMALDTLVSMQDRVDPEKVEAMRGKEDVKPPVIVQFGGRNYIADGHHRCSAAYLDGKTSIPVKVKNIEPLDVSLKAVTIYKNASQRMVYGWASVTKIGDEEVVDHHGDVIETDDLVKAVTEFMEDVRLAKAMHDGDGIGQVVHSFPMTYEIAKSLGIDIDREGWIVGVKVKDDAQWAKVEDGTLKAFSIGGKGYREELEAA